MMSIVEAEGCDPSSRNLQFSNFTFDASMLEIFGVINAGETLFVAPTLTLLSDIAGCINSMGVTHLFLTPSVAKLLSPLDVPDLLSVFVGGEALGLDMVAAWAPTGKLMNHGLKSQNGSGQ
jgi:non-ribosomal peptide synthetase component F